MDKALIVLKPERLRKISLRQWFRLLAVLVIAMVLLSGLWSFPHLSEENTHTLTGPISDIRIMKDRGRHRSDRAVFTVSGEECSISLHNHDLRQLLESAPTDTARVILSEEGQVAELEYGGTLYHTLEQENANRRLTRILSGSLGVVLILLAIGLATSTLVSYSVVILRKRPKNITNSILIEK